MLLLAAAPPGDQVPERATDLHLQLLGELTRHFLLMTATPHNGKEEDFQLFLALLDADRFEGRFRDGVHQVDVSDLMRRMVSFEKLISPDVLPAIKLATNAIEHRLADDQGKRKINIDTGYIALSHLVLATCKGFAG